MYEKSSRAVGNLLLDDSRILSCSSTDTSVASNE